MLFGKPKRIVKRILIVEDEPLTAFDNETMLEELGYTVVATHDRVKDALATLAREKVDLIMSDVKLAGDRSGIDLARIAKEKAIPVLFATGMVRPTRRPSWWSAA
jgi:CheY-like chemotaxis protein